jgi:hypothetical protein
VLKLGGLKKWEDVKLCVVVGEANKIQRIFFFKKCGFYLLWLVGGLS